MRFCTSGSRKSRGQTLVDLLAALAILTLFMQLLFPALQAAREASRRIRCSARLRHLGLAMNAHQVAKGHFPSGGWHFHWIGEPERGTNSRQPGSWAFNLLDYLDQSDLRRKGAGLQGTERWDALADRCSKPLAIFYCPSRRAVRAYPYHANRRPLTLGGRALKSFDLAAKTDYAANAGDGPSVEFDWKWSGPNSLLQGDRPAFRWPDATCYTGVIFGRSQIYPRKILDGLSKTYLLGEKVMDASQYQSGKDWGDNETLYAGFNNDNCRSTEKVPVRDRHNRDFKNRFGSAHPQVWQVVFCDGSVQAKDFGIDAEVHRRFGNRMDVRQSFPVISSLHLP
ncbi:MAG: DUF1559 domain-containing protein [Planctomycetaceae bacterium]|nr:DUF1559 domain-containing protein [Planctomycetaceae bacterium]